MKQKLAIVIPCYNEQAVLPITAPLFLDQLNLLIDKYDLSEESFILFCDDGSKDTTWSIIASLAHSNSRYQGLKGSRNRGHQNVVLGGLMFAKDHADFTISIDCDGQDDIHAMDEMVDKYMHGCEVVYGVRNDRGTDTWFKRTTAQGFYKFLNSMGANVVYNHADYRLLSSKVLNELSHYPEVNLFLRGLVPLVGFKSDSVYYSREKRVAGESHYPLGKMMGLAIDGITSLSVKPLHLISLIGIVISGISFVGLIWSLITYFVGSTVTGWTSMVAIMCFVSGIQLLCIGVLGEYIGKLYMESKHRPRYIFEDNTVTHDVFSDY